jgi:hypothetical protein
MADIRYETGKPLKAERVLCKHPLKFKNNLDKTAVRTEF